MPDSDFLVTITMAQQEDRLHKVLTYIKSKQPQLQERIETDLKFKSDMALSVTCAGVAAMILACERMAGHAREVNLTQALKIINYYLEKGGEVFSPDQVPFG